MMSATPIPRTLAMSLLRRSRRLGDRRAAARAARRSRRRLVADTRRDEVIAARARCVRRGQPGVLGMPADRGVARRCSCRPRSTRMRRLRDRLPRTHGRAGARAPAGGRESGGDARVQARRRSSCWSRRRHRSRRRRAECDADGDRACRAHGPFAAAPAARPRRARRGSEHCILLYQSRCRRLARERLQDHLRKQRRIRDRAAGPALRGPGELLGARQSGVPMLRFADLAADVDLLEAARDVAQQLLRDDPRLPNAICSDGWAASSTICACSA